MNAKIYLINILIYYIKKLFENHLILFFYCVKLAMTDYRYNSIREMIDVYLNYKSTHIPILSKYIDDNFDKCNGNIECLTNNYIDYMKHNLKSQYNPTQKSIKEYNVQLKDKFVKIGTLSSHFNLDRIDKDYIQNPDIYDKITKRLDHDSIYESFNRCVRMRENRDEINKCIVSTIEIEMKRKLL